ncbi:MAG: hypothetical protein R3212_14600, partial [Xanthomonadales bacterium]|nr:hypothetical protein [Xanthomonadales bacterium]
MLQATALNIPLISRIFILLAIAFTLPTKQAIAEWVERPDAMHWHRLADFDVVEDRVRVLYYSQPSLEQSVQPGWTINVYISELYRDGRIETRQLATGQRHFASLRLQRGGDGVFALVAPYEEAPGNTLEYWSAQDGTVRATSAPAALESAVGGIFATADGNLFTATQSAQSSRGNEPTTLTLTKLSPQGEVLATGTWSNPTAISTAGGAFAVPGGGMGVALDMRVVRGAKALETDIEAIQHYEIAGRNVEARVFAETRLLAMDSTGNVLWKSPALERDLGWDGEMSIPQDLPVDEMMAQNNEQMALMSRVTLENGGDRRLESLATSGFDDIQKTPNGYGVLARIAADRSLQPPQHGVWFMEVGDDGTLRRELRIQPAADRLDAKFERFMPTADGGLLVAGVRRAGDTFMHLTALDAEGEIEWTTRLGINNVQLEGIAGTESHPWVFGHGWNEAGNKNLMWAELVDPADAEALPAAA